MKVSHNLTKRSSFGNGGRVVKKRRQSLERVLVYLILVMGTLLLYVNTLLFHPSHDGGSSPTSPGDASPAGGTIQKNVEPFMKLLRHADVADTPELRSQFPDWQVVVDRFGDKPVIVGLERCQQFRETVPLAKRWLAAAGAFNSGTNFLFDMLTKNCRIPGPRKSSGEGVGGKQPIEKMYFLCVLPYDVLLCDRHGRSKLCRYLKQSTNNFIAMYRYMLNAMQ